MALQHINTIQNQKDLAYIITNSTYFNYESLANLGQRYSPKGDGIKSNSFKISDLVSGIGSSESNEIVKLYINNNKLLLSVFDVDNLNIPKYTEEIKYSINNSVITDSPLSLNTKINGIDYYKENMLIFIQSENNKEYLYIASIGCTDNIVYELNIECYDIAENIMIESIKVIDTNEENVIESKGSNVPAYYLYYITKVNKTVKDDKEYCASEYKINIETINTLYNSFSTFVLSFYNSVILEYYKQYGVLRINDILNEMLQYGFVSTSDKNSILLTRDNSNDNGYEIEEEYQNNVQLKTIIHYIYNQELIMYMFIFEYYCNIIYMLDNSQLKKYILYKLYDTAYNISGNKDNIYNTFEMFFPIDYTIDYYANDNTSYIYCNETPINILFTNQVITDNLIGTIFTDSNRSRVAICNAVNLDTVILFKFSVEYNESNSNVINNIIFSKLYSTPYIQDNYWVINDIKSIIHATGKDAGNPNIIMIYNNGTKPIEGSRFEKNPIISAIDDYFLENSLTWESVYVNVKLFEEEYIKLNVGKEPLSSHYNIITYVPVINELSDYAEQLKNAFIINITELSDKTLELGKYAPMQYINDYYGSRPCITTFWRYNNSVKRFENITDPCDDKNGGLTLTNLSNVNTVSLNMAKLVNNISNDKRNKFNEVVITNPYVLKNQVNLNNNENAISTVITHTAYNTINKTYLTNDINLTKYNNNSILSIYNVNNISSSKINTTNSAINIGEEKNKYEYVINNNIPTIALSDYLVSDSQMLNRINLITVGKPNNNSSNLYYSYIGSSIDEENKNVLHIGSSDINYSLGTYLSNTSVRFSKQEALSIDFDKVIMNNTHTYYSNSRHISTSHIIDSYYLIKQEYIFNVADVVPSDDIINQSTTYKNIITSDIGKYGNKIVTSINNSYYCLIEQKTLINELLNTKVNTYIHTNVSVINTYSTVNGTEINSTNGKIYICVNVSKYNLSKLSNWFHLPVEIEAEYVDGIYNEIYINFPEFNNIEFGWDPME